MKNKLLTEIKEYIYSLRDEYGNWRDEPIGIVAKAKTPSENILVAKDIISVIISSDNISMETKIYINNRLANIKDSNKLLNEMIDSANAISKTDNIISHKSYNSTVVKISQDNDKLTEILGADTLKNIIYNRPFDKDKTKKIIDNFLLEYGQSDNSRDNLDLFIRKDLVSKTYSEGSNAFFDRLSDLEPYLIQRKRIIEEVINADEEFVGYFNYLLNSSAINDNITNRDRDRLLKYLNNQDYVTGYIEESNDSSENNLNINNNNGNETTEFNEDDIKVEW